jgi:hypothetical protein
MLAWLKYRRKLTQLRNERSQASAEATRVFREGKLRGDTPKQIFAAHEEKMQVVYDLDEQINEHEAEELVRIAERYHLPIPPQAESEFWTRGAHGVWFLLTDHGFTKIRSLIREERKQRDEALLRWAPTLISLASLAVAAIAVLHK